MIITQWTKDVTLQVILPFLTGILTSVFLFSTVSCATLNVLEQADIKTAVRIATVLYVDSDPQKAEDVLFVINETRKDISEYQEITIAKATEFVRQNIVWKNLKPIEALAADAVITRISAAIDYEIAHAKIPPNKIVLVHNVLDWIEEAVVLSQFYIKPSQRAVPENAIITNSVIMFETTNGLSTIEE